MATDRAGDPLRQYAMRVVAELRRETPHLFLAEVPEGLSAAGDPPDDLPVVEYTRPEGSPSPFFVVWEMHLAGEQLVVDIGGADDDGSGRVDGLAPHLEPSLLLVARLFVLADQVDRVRPRRMADGLAAQVVSALQWEGISGHTRETTLRVAYSRQRREVRDIRVRGGRATRRTTPEQDRLILATYDEKLSAYRGRFTVEAIRAKTLATLKKDHGITISDPTLKRRLAKRAGETPDQR